MNQIAERPSRFAIAYNNTVGWAHARNLIKGATPKDQYLKLVEEVMEELFLGMETSDRALIIDAIGDGIVVATVISEQIGSLLKPHIEVALASRPGHGAVNGLCIAIGRGARFAVKGQNEKLAVQLGIIVASLEQVANLYSIDVLEAFESAYNEIKDRRGIMHNGAFVKTDDPLYESIIGLYQSEEVNQQEAKA
jgi:hypothetical protein